MFLTFHFHIFRSVFLPEVLSPFTIIWALWSADSDKFRSGRYAGGEDRAAAVESNYGFPTFPGSPREYIGNVFAKEKLKCSPVAAIGGSKFEQGRKREVAVMRGSQRRPRGYTRCG